MGLFQTLFPQAALNREIAKTKLKALNLVSGGNSGTGYGQHGAGSTKKSLFGWRTSSADADSDITYNLDILRQRSRDLHAGAPLANGALKTIVTNVVGAGLKLNAAIDYEFLRLSKDEANKIERQIEREFKLWAENKYACDLAATLNFYEMQALALLSTIMSGDCFALLPVVERAGSVYDIKVNLIESDRVCNPLSNPAQNFKILEGVEVDNNGMPVAYHIANRHPYSVIPNDKPTKWEKVPAFGEKTGRRNVLHLFTVERPSQRRGLPLLAPVLETFKQLQRYTDAEIMAAVVSGMFSVFIKSDTPGTALGQQNIPAQNRVSDDSNDYELGNGLVMELNPGESVEVANPGRPNTAFDGFVMAVLRQIGTALEIPYELLVKHFTASYSASRAAIMQAWAMFKTRREWLVNNFCQPVYNEWLAEAVAKGRLNMPGFFENPLYRQAWSGVQFFGTAMPQIDPQKEANAAAIRCEQGFSTRGKEAAEMSGMNYDELAAIREGEELARDKFSRSEKPIYTGVINGTTLEDQQPSQQ